jgi:uncharacterized Ntn-hydrolase superfamily protein
MPAVFCATFSIVAGAEGEFGVAVSTARPAVGALVPHVCLGGAIATQAWVNIGLGLDGVARLAAGAAVDATLAALLAADPGAAHRQVHGIDAAGRQHAHTGAECVPWAGHRLGSGFSVAGNMLVGEGVLDAMARAFTGATTTDLAERLLLALEAGQAAGGDKRGKQSAALLVASPRPRVYHNLRVDDHAEPVAELRRIFTLARAGDPERRARYEGTGVAFRTKW